MSRILKVASSALALALLVGACGSDDDDGETSTGVDDTQTSAPAGDADEASQSSGVELQDNPNEGITSDEIRVGFMADLTGPASTVMAYELAGAKAAAEYINANGGVLGRDLVIVERNDNFKVEEAKVNLRTLVQDDKVLAVTGVSNSAVTSALGPDFTNAGIAAVGPPQTTDAQVDVPYYLNNIPSYADQAAVAVERLAERVGGGDELKAAVIRLSVPSGEEWDNDVRAELEEVGGEYLGTTTFEATNPDATTVVSNIAELARTEGLNAVVFQALVPHALSLLQGLNDGGLLDGSIYIVGTTPMANPGVFQNAPAAAADVAEGVHGALPANAEAPGTAVIREFVAGTAYEEQSVFPDFGHGWANVMIIAQAIEAAAEANGGDVGREEFYEAVQAKWDTEGVMCEIDWSDSNDSPCGVALRWDGSGLVADRDFASWAEVLD